eukprot:TRINITY_DN11248_c0_g1_i15.p1 TRINITY_DN11248_c0_g1~~TRINITY_DN11248_c0_g1_i15.p1  ORF type:complete len:181 (-),score=35.04 TRINITY_DN11248_c0_g1_i15:129-671(-)
MTVKAPAARYGKKVYQTKEAPERNQPGKRQFKRPRSPVLSALGEFASARGKKVWPHAWKPSNDLVEFNEKNRLPLFKSRRLKKEVEGKELNKSSIVGMMGLSEVKKVSSKKRCLDSSKMDKILSYKNGPKYREIKITEKVPKVNIKFRSSTPEAMKVRKLQFLEYSINKVNNSTSRVVFG